MNRNTQINLILKEYFDMNISVKKVAARYMMPYFVLGGVFKNDDGSGLPIHNFLRNLEQKNQLQLIPFAIADKKEVYTKWYFVQRSITVEKILAIQKKSVSKRPIKKVPTKTIPKLNL